jgi:rare lipoprotein A
MTRTIPKGLILLCSLLALGCAGTQPQLKPEVALTLVSHAPEPALAGAPALMKGPLAGASALTEAASVPELAITEPVDRKDVGTGRAQVGRASYYHSFFDGRTTANGETFSNQAMTAAHRTLEFGTRVLVTNLMNSKSVVVTINDRGPYVSGRIIDLSRRAASKLGFVQHGLARVKVQVL